MARIYVTFPPRTRVNYYRDDALRGLAALGEVALNPHARTLSTRELIDAAGGCEFIVSDRPTAGDAELFQGLPNLIAFARCAVDVRNVDIAAASERGILVTQASAGFVTGVSEWVLGVMIDLSRNVTAAASLYRAGEMPVPVMGRELKGSTIGVVGYGQIGRCVCDMALALGMRVVVTTPGGELANPALIRLDLEALLSASDYVVCLAPANAETENMFDAATFARMKPGAYFINASRGELVDESALERALDGGLIAGCALDVGRAPDQMPTPRLARHPKVIATPHVGGLTPQAADHQALETVAQLAAIVKGEVPAGALNAAQATRLARLR